MPFMEIWNSCVRLGFFPVDLIVLTLVLQTCNPASTSARNRGDASGTTAAGASASANAIACGQTVRNCRLIILGNTTNLTTFYNPNTNIFSAGPVTSANVNWSPHSFIFTSGTQAGKTLLVQSWSSSVCIRPNGFSLVFYFGWWPGR